MDKQKTFCDDERTGSGGWKRGVALTEQTCPGRSSVEPLRVFTKTSTLTKQRHLKAVFIQGVRCTNFGAVRENVCVLYPNRVPASYTTCPFLCIYTYASQSRGMEFCVCAGSSHGSNARNYTHRGDPPAPITPGFARA
jgi:hypothetical protein